TATRELVERAQSIAAEAKREWGGSGCHARERSAMRTTFPGAATGLRLDPEHRNEPLLVLGVDAGDDLDVRLDRRATQLGGQELVDLEDARAVGHGDLDAHRLLAPGRDAHLVDR